MNIKLIRNALVITVIIMVISVMGKTSAHDLTSRRLAVGSNPIIEVMINR